jgi:hypothetical protein
MASGGGYWVSTVDNNMTDPDTGGAGWSTVDTNGITALTGDVTATGPGSSAATLAASGVTAGSYTGANITVDAKGRVTYAATPGLLAATDGYVTLPGGIIMQWGYVVVNSYPQLVNFPIPFPTTCYGVTATDNAISGSLRPQTVGAVVVSNSQFQIGSSGYPVGTFWTAIGK